MKKHYMYYLILFFLLLGVGLSFKTQTELSAVSGGIDINSITIAEIIDKSKKVTEFIYTAENTIKPDEGVFYTRKVWAKENIARMEMTMYSKEGSPSYTQGLIFKEGQEEYSQYRIEHQQQAGTSTSGVMTVGRIEGEEQTFLNSVIYLEQDSAKITGENWIAGQQCVIVESQGAKVWISTKDFIPLRLEVGPATTEFKDVKIGPGTVKDKDLAMPADASPVTQAQSTPPLRNFELYTEPFVVEPGTKNKSLTPEQLESFLKEKELTPLAVKDVGVWTIVLYEDEYEMGHYILTADATGRIHESQGKGSSNADVVPVSVGGGGNYSIGTGSVCFIKVIINDPKILKEAYLIKVTQEGQEDITELTNGQKGLIIPAALNPGSGSGQRVTIVLNKEGKELFNSQKFKEDFYR